MKRRTFMQTLTGALASFAFVGATQLIEPEFTPQSVKRGPWLITGWDDKGMPVRWEIVPDENMCITLPRVISRIYITDAQPVEDSLSMPVAYTLPW